LAILFESEHSSEKRKKTPLEVTLLRSESPRSGVPKGTSDLPQGEKGAPKGGEKKENLKK
jgi:hypothetical protein